MKRQGPVLLLFFITVLATGACSAPPVIITQERAVPVEPDYHYVSYYRLFNTLYIYRPPFGTRDVILEVYVSPVDDPYRSDRDEYREADNIARDFIGYLHHHYGWLDAERLGDFYWPARRSLRMGKIYLSTSADSGRYRYIMHIGQEDSSVPFYGKKKEWFKKTAQQLHEAIFREFDLTVREGVEPYYQ